MKRLASRPLLALSLLGAIGWVASPGRAGIWDDLRERVGAITGTKSSKREQALQARQKAAALDARAASARSRLASAQRALLEANRDYAGVARAAKKLEADIVRQRHRRFLVTERYNRRRILFGRRLAAMQRTGSTGYLQVFLGSSTLADLARRAYLFRALIERDATLQTDLKSDKAQIEALSNELSAQWSRRNRLRQAAFREQKRVARATRAQQSELQRLVSSRDALQAFAAQRVEEVKALNQSVLDYNARAQTQAIAAAREAQAEQEEAERRQEVEEASRRETYSLRRRYRYASASSNSDDEEEPRRYRSSYRSSRTSSRRDSNRYAEDDEPRSRRSYRSYRSSYNNSYNRSYGRRWRRTRYNSTRRPRTTYVRVRMAERIDRVRQVPTLGGSLRPMTIPEIIFKEKTVPITSGGGSNSGASNTSGDSGGVARDDFPASDP